MTLSDDHISSLESADLRVREAKALYDHARRLRDMELRRVAAEGGTYREMATVSGVAYQRVAQIVTGKEPPAREWNDFLKVECPKCGAAIGEQCTNARGIYAHPERHDAAYELFIAEHPELG